MCIQNVPVYAGTMRTCVSTCARGAGAHGDVLNLHTDGVLYIHTGRQGVIVSSKSVDLHHFQFENRSRATRCRFLQTFAVPDKAVRKCKCKCKCKCMCMCMCMCTCVKVYVYAHMYLFMTFHNGFMFFATSLLFIFIYI